MEINDAVKSKIENYVSNNKVVLFMKGTPQQPQCGFSAKTVAALDSVIPDYVAVNVLDDAEIREGIKVYGNWPTIPQLYIDGELVGGCDIVLTMLNSGELHQTLGMEQPDRTAPDITVTPAAAEKILEAMEGHEGIGLHFAIDANWSSQFNLAPAQGHEIVSPMAPAPVRQMTVQELAEALKSGSITLVDVRGEDERARASIEGARGLDRETMEQLEQLPKDTAIAFLCHHGNSSMGAAEYFRKQGFTNISNVAGGIHAWSMEIDSSVPAY